MNRALRFATCFLLLAASIAWGKYSITPAMERLSAEKERIEQHEALLAEWGWVEAETVPGSLALDPADRLTVDAITSKIAASRVSLARLAESPDGSAQFETRGDFVGLIRFLDRLAGTSCQLLRVRKNAEAGLRASFRTAAD